MYVRLLALSSHFPKALRWIERDVNAEAVHLSYLPHAHQKRIKKMFFFPFEKHINSIHTCTEVEMPSSVLRGCSVQLVRVQPYLCLRTCWSMWLIKYCLGIIPMNIQNNSTHTRETGYSKFKICSYHVCYCATYWYTCIYINYIYVCAQ